MHGFNSLRSIVSLTTLIATLLLQSVTASEPKGEPIKVYILSGQSNMVGASKVDGGSSRWGSEFIGPVVSVYAESYAPNADYDSLTPTTTLKLESFGGGEPTPYPGGGTQVTRGFVQVIGDAMGQSMVELMKGN